VLRRACGQDDLWEGEMRPCSIAGRPIVLINAGGQVSAFADFCPHQRFPLHRGRLVGTTLTCAAHEWQYDACTGAGLNPRDVALQRFPVQLHDDAIWIDIDETSDSDR
jgi:toluene monooxygenase system ferredoxin subunit